MKYYYSIKINSSAEKVFYWLGTPEKAMVWQRSVSKTEILKQTPDMTGTTFKEVIAEDGRSTEMQGIVLNYQKPQLLSMHLEGRYNAVDVEYRLTESEGKTLLTLNSNIQFKSFMRLFSVIIWPVFKKKLIEQTDREYTRLKQLCEEKQ